MKHRILLAALILFALGAASASALNPILPDGVYGADPEAHQWADGRVYVYGSHDVTTQTYCTTDYHVYSSADLAHWTDHGVSFSSAGAGDQVPYSDERLYAPDAIFRNGTYYLYYCLSGGGDDEGVATSKSPFGPFTGGTKIAGMRGIDPGVLIDDDGQAYIYWGQIRSKAAKLKPNMLEIDQATSKTNVITEAGHHFHEASSMRKRNGIYYYVYADIERNRKPTCLGYATSTSPLGPFTYRGVIIDNAAADTGAWNNHGCIAEVNGKWYVFYHRPTHGSTMLRKICVEPITFNADGTIPEVEMTSQGAEGPLNAFEKLEAEVACGLSGTVRTDFCSEGGDGLNLIKNGNSAVYKYLDFGAGAAGFEARVAGAAGGKIEIHLDKADGPLAGTCTVPAGAGQAWTTQTCKIQGAQGVHAVYLKFTGEGAGNLFQVNRFKFTK